MLLGGSPPHQQLCLIKLAKEETPQSYLPHCNRYRSSTSLIVSLHLCSHRLGRAEGSELPELLGTLEQTPFFTQQISGVMVEV